MTSEEDLLHSSIERLIKKYRHNDLEGARTEAQRLTEIYPTHPFGWKMLGIIFSILGETSLALDAHQRAGDLDPTDPETFNNLSITLRESGRSAEAESASRKAISLKEAFPNAHCNLANALNQLGRLEEAEASYHRALQLQPNSPEALSNLGLTLLKMGRNIEAENCCSEAVRLSPNNSVRLNNYGFLLFTLGRYNLSEEICRKAVQCDPLSTYALNNLANALRELGRFEEAEACYLKALRLDKNFADAHSNLGAVLNDLGRFEESKDACLQAISLNPKSHLAHTNLANALSELGQFREAEVNHKKALEIYPDFVQGRSNLGSVLVELGKFTEAEETCRFAINLDASFPPAYNNLANALKEQGKFKEAEAAYKKALELKPDFVEAIVNYAIMLQEIRRIKEAEAFFLRALEHQSDFAKAQVGLSTLKLAKKDFSKGFQLYEWRWKTKQQIGKRLGTAKPEWSGQHMSDVLVWWEQGIGDFLMFSSILNEMAGVCRRLMVCCDERLLSIFRRSFSNSIKFLPASSVIPEEQYDYHIPIGSLPKFFRRDEKEFENGASAFLMADSERTQDLKKRLNPLDNPVILGISWRGGKNKSGSLKERVIDLGFLVSGLTSPGVRFVSLQYGSTEEEIRSVREEYKIEIKTIPEIDNFHDLDGLASLIRSCDKVISVDNATVFLSGALGVETHVLLPFCSDWRWGTEGSRSYWHEDLTLYRQKTGGDWTVPLQELKRNLS